MVIRPGEDADVPAIVALLEEADDARVISVDSVRHIRRTRPSHARIIELVAEDDGKILAAGYAGLNISTSTPGAAWAFITVTADRRRRGIGSTLCARLLEHLREVEATKVNAFARHTEEGERWALARGFRRAITAPLIAADPRKVPEPEVPERFRCVPLSELAAEELYDVVCEAALDEPSTEPNDAIEFDEFVREWEDPVVDLAASGAVLHGDEVVAFSFLRVAGDRAQHGFTGTARAYRGRGFATAAKRFALHAAATRGVTRVTTSNAEENVAMRAINRRLGFEPIGEQVIYERDL